MPMKSTSESGSTSASSVTDTPRHRSAYRSPRVMRLPRTSFGERDLLDGAAVREVGAAGAETARPGEADGRCDEDAAAGAAAAASGEREGGGREIDRPFEAEGAATRNGVGRARRDRSVLEEEHPLHRSARGGGERSAGAAADGHWLVPVGAASGVVEGDPRAAYRAAPAHAEAAPVEDVGARHEGHAGGSTTDGDAVAVDARSENGGGVATDALVDVIATPDRGGCPSGERVRLWRNPRRRRRGVAATRGVPGDGDRGGGHAGASAAVHRAVAARVDDDAARGVYGSAAGRVERVVGRRVQRIDAVGRIQRAGDRARAHRRTIEAEDSHEDRGTGLRDDGFHEPVVAGIEAAAGRVIDHDLRPTRAVGEPVRSGGNERRRLDLRVVRIS